MSRTIFKNKEEKLAEEKPLEEKKISTPEVTESSVVSKIEEKPLNVMLKITDKIAVVGIRIIKGKIIFNDGVRMVNLPIKEGAPITITMRQ